MTRSLHNSSRKVFARSFGCCTTAVLCDGALQYVFALLRGSDGMVGGHLYWSDYYGKPDTWDDRTNEMTGKLRVVLANEGLRVALSSQRDAVGVNELVEAGLCRHDV